MTPVISQLQIYPLKSGKGLSLKEMTITSTGPQFDRQWMIAKPNGQFLSQRTHPTLGQIQPKLTKNHLLLSAPGMDELAIPLEPTEGPKLEVKIFGKNGMALKLGSQFDEWASDFLNVKVHIVRSMDGGSRKTSGNNGPITPINFPDGYPFLLINQSSLDVLSRQLSKPISIDRFRPNIVIETKEHDVEDLWKSFKINSLSFLSVKACVRCKIIDIDPSSGNFSKEVSSALKTYRYEDGNILFGQNLIHQNQGTIRVGDALTNIALKG